MTDPQREREQSVNDRKAVAECSPLVRSSELLHRDIRHILSDYLDGDLPVYEQERVQNHLDSCPDCQSFLATLRKTIRILDTLPRPAAPTDARQSVIEALKGEEYDRRAGNGGPGF